MATILLSGCNTSAPTAGNGKESGESQETTPLEPKAGSIAPVAANRARTYLPGGRPNTSTPCAPPPTMILPSGWTAMEEAVPPERDTGATTSPPTPNELSRAPSELNRMVPIAAIPPVTLGSSPMATTILPPGSNAGPEQDV